MCGVVCALKKKNVVGKENTSTLHLGTLTACHHIREMGQLWMNSEDRNTHQDRNTQMLLRSIFLACERWSLLPSGHQLATSQDDCSEMAAVGSQQSTWGEQQVHPARSSKGTSGQREIVLCLSVREAFISV